jgi:hypothetical protein
MVVENFTKLVDQPEEDEEEHELKGGEPVNEELIVEESAVESMDEAVDEEPIAEEHAAEEPIGEPRQPSVTRQEPNRVSFSEPKPSPKPTRPSGASSSQSETYQQRLWKHKREDAEERKRILRLVETDRQEQRANQEYHQRRLSQSSPKPRALSMSQTESRIVIRLFDGSAIKNVFEGKQTLGSVRDWVDQNRTDGDHPYTLVQTFPMRKFGPLEEGQTLRELDLVPSTTLILKPATNASNIAYSSTGWFNNATQTFADAVYTFLGIGFRPPQNEEEATTEPAKATTARQSPSPPQNQQKKPDDNNDRITYNGNQLSLKDDSDIDASHIN